MAPPPTIADRCRLIAADHPSVEPDVERFLAVLRSEPRFFGPRARAAPKPFPSLIDALGRRSGFRVAAVADGEISGLITVDAHGDVAIAVAAERRGHGIGTALGRAAVARAIDLGYRRLVVRSSQRSHAARRVGEALGCTVIDVGRGRTDLILDLVETGEHIA